MRNATRTGPPAAVACLLLAGCAASALLTGCAASGPTAVPSREPEPVPVVAEPAPAPAAPPVEPVTNPPAPAAPPRAEVALIFDTTTPAHAPVAAEIEAALPARRFRVTRFPSSAEAELTAFRGRRLMVVAVGSDAVRAARAALPDQPLVFCQVPADDEALQAGGEIWGVEPLPPLALQLESWQAIDPTLRTIALIVSAAGAGLAEEARAAAASLATDLIVETSASDRETLYLFRRLATTVDGLWLLPDNDALSPQVLRELLRYASSRGVGVLTFNDALLPRGALLSATAVPADVAANVARIVERVAAGRTADLPLLTPLSAAELTINVGVAAALGLPPVAVQRWVTRVAD
jgi:ABC-type uncharacterized transport system substrate-binding protein